MNEHNLFYYPYASFTDAQIPLLKVAALYFDKLIILDPVGAGWNTIGADYPAREAVRQLKDAGILELVSPAAVLSRYETPMMTAIRHDMAYPAFLDLCEAHRMASNRERWTLSLSKVPEDLQADQRLRYLMGDFARETAAKAAYAAEDYIEHIDAISYLPGNNRSIPSGALQRAQDYRSYAETGEAYDEYREGYDKDVEYRYADFPLALGEAIMMNHALFAGLLYAGATPITDDPFHSQALVLKLRQGLQDPAVLKAQEERARMHKANRLAMAALADTQLQLPILDPAVPLDEVLSYRQKHADALQEAREKLGWMARRIEAEPWSADFASELEHKTIPDLHDALIQAGKDRDSWLQSGRGKSMLKAVGVAVGTAAAVLTLVATPAAPVALAVAGLGLASASLPGAEWLMDWRDGKKAVQENGLHYLLST